MLFVFYYKSGSDGMSVLQVMQMVIAILTESDMKLSEELLEAIIDKVINHFLGPVLCEHALFATWI